MSITPTKAQRSKVIDLLEAYVQDRDTVSAEEAADAMLDLTWRLYEDRAKYTVVGQLHWSDGEWLDPEDARASKVALGRYTTEKQAQDAADSLVFSHATGEQLRVWVLPVHHGSPHEWFKGRQQAMREAGLSDFTPRERELQRRIQWFRDNPDALTFAPEDKGEETEDV